MGAAGLYRCFIWAGTPRFWQDWRPHPWSKKDLHAGEEQSVKAPDVSRPLFLKLACGRCTIILLQKIQHISLIEHL